MGDGSAARARTVSFFLSDRHQTLSSSEGTVDSLRLVLGLYMTR